MPTHIFLVCSFAAFFAALLITIKKLVLGYSSRKDKQHAFARQHNCATPTSVYPHNPFLLRLDLLFEIGSEIVNRRFTEGIRRRFGLFGSTFVAALGYRDLVFTVDSENLQAIFGTNFHDWTIIAARQKLIRVLFGDGVFSTEGEAWKHSRAIVSRSMRSIDLSVSIFEKYTQRLVQQVKAVEEKEVELGGLVCEYTMDASADIVLGADDSLERRQFSLDFAKVGTMAKGMTIFVRIIPYLGQMMYGREFSETRSRVHNYVQGLIGVGKTGDRNETEPLVHGLSRQEDDADRVRAEVLNLLLAGRDVGVGLSELFYLLSRHPKVWAKLREEVGPAKIESLPQLQKMTYLSFVLNEALRLRPTLAVHARRAVCDTVLPRGGGVDNLEPIFVARGTFVVYSNYSLHRNPKVFGEDVDAFRPERWADISPARYECLSFGAGPRHCPGKKMASAMMAYLTARLVQEFEEIQSVGNEPWEEEISFSFTNRHGVRAVLRANA